MANVTKDVKFNITQQSCGDAEECIEVKISGDENVALYLTPQQARALASDLIQTVYRAEVKNSLSSKKCSVSPSRSSTSGESLTLHSQHAA